MGGNRVKVPVLQDRGKLMLFFSKDILQEPKSAVPGQTKSLKIFCVPVFCPSMRSLSKVLPHPPPSSLQGLPVFAQSLSRYPYFVVKRVLKLIIAQSKQKE
jgi:hypothetical protein